MDQRTDATAEDQHYTAHESGPINVSDIERAGAESYPRVEVVERVEAPTSSLRANLRNMAAAGCKRAAPGSCPPGDGRCFNCQAADFIAKTSPPEDLARRDAIIASLKTDVVAVLGKHAKTVAVLDDVADRLSQAADIGLDLVGALLQADEAFARMLKVRPLANAHQFHFQDIALKAREGIV
jgi:hypothetical protein